jgi:hypothetical protein
VCFCSFLMCNIKQEQKKVGTGQLASWADDLRKMLIDDSETVAGALKRLAQEKREKREAAKSHVKADPLFARPVARQKEGRLFFCHGPQNAFCVFYNVVLFRWR